MILSSLALPNTPLPSRHLPHLPLPNLFSSLLSLSLLPSLPAMAGCCVLGRRGRTPWALSLPLGSSSSSSSSPHPPQQRSVQQRRVREEEGTVAIVLALTLHQRLVVERQTKQARGCFHGPHCQQPHWKIKSKFPVASYVFVPLVENHVTSINCGGCHVQGWLFETGCPLRKLKLKLKLKLVIVIRCSLVCSITFLRDDTLSGCNRFRTMIFLPEYPFQKSSPKIRFSRSKFNFLQRLSNFQEIQENLLQRLPISKKPSSTAFQFLQRLSDNIIFQSWKICVWTNRHSTSMASNFQETFFNGFPISSTAFW